MPKLTEGQLYKVPGGTTAYRFTEGILQPSDITPEQITQETFPRTISPEILAQFQAPAKRPAGIEGIDDEALKFLKTQQAPFATSTNLMDQILQGFKDMPTFAEREERLETLEEKRRKALLETQRAGERRITSQFARLIGEAEEIGRQEIGVARAVLARQAGGLGESTVAMGAMEQVTKGAERRVAKLRMQREEAISNLDFKAAAQLDKIYNDTAEELNKLYKEAWQQKVDIFNIQNTQVQQQRLQVQTDFNIMSKLSDGEIWTSPSTGVTYTGIGKEKADAFFTSSNIVSMMKAIPMGSTKQITDPGTGEVWTITGLGAKDINTKIYNSIDAAGNMHIIKVNEETGKVQELAVVKGVGKPKSPTAADKDVAFKQDVGSMSAQLDSVKGTDGYISPEDYKTAKRAWVAEGYSSKDFDESFSVYINPDRYEEYTL